MKRALVIADDLSGAAEIAGIGQRFGLSTRLLLERAIGFDDGLTVIDADSRLLSPEKSGQRVRELIREVDASGFDLIFKKTDSALRGQILIELSAMMQSLGFAHALLLAQNPSRGRTIVDGEYRIDGVPLHQTSFADDPDRPAHSSDVVKLLGSSISVCDPWH